MQVLDYSAGLIDGQAIKNAGYGGAVRYIGFPDRRKCTTKSEFDRFTAAGIGMALVFENNTTDWRGGFAQGAASGRLARNHANAISFSADRPIYMAIDQDVTGIDFNLAMQYLHGASTTLGGAYATGVYGEADVIDRARAYRVDGKSVCSFFWQTAAWSHGRKTTANLFQHVGVVYVGGIACDINDVLTDDWGQHDYKGDDMSVEDAEAGTRKYFQGTDRPNAENPAGGGKRSLEQVIFTTNEWQNEALILLRGLTGQLTSAEIKVLTAVRADRPVVEMDGDDIQALLSGFSATTKSAIREVLGSLDA